MEDKNEPLQTCIDWEILENGHPGLVKVKIDTITEGERDALELNTVVMLLALGKLLNAAVAIMKNDERDAYIDSVNTIWRSILVETGIQEQPDRTALQASISLIDGLMTIGGYTEPEVGEFSPEELWKAVGDVSNKYLALSKEKEKEK